MDFTVKYRPKRFDEVVGHQEICKVLRVNKDYQVLLFYGPSGVGKTTLARLYAMHVCCEKGDIEECRGSCRACRAISEGEVGDFLEENIGDARGIDDMRRLVEWVKYRPLVLRKRVLILDEVHMLTRPAQNLLLKVLEEPPSYALIMLCTTDASGLIEPLRQRCFQFELKKVGEVGLCELAKKVILKEVEERKIKVDTDEIVLIVKNAVERSDGRPRRLLRYLQLWFDGGVKDWDEVEGEEEFLYNIFESLVQDYDLGVFQRIVEICEKEDSEKLIRIFESWVRKKILKSKDFLEARGWVQVLEKFSGFWIPKISEKNIVFWKIVGAGLEARKVLRECRDARNSESKSSMGLCD